MRAEEGAGGRSLGVITPQSALKKTQLIDDTGRDSDYFSRFKIGSIKFFTRIGPSRM